MAGPMLALRSAAEAAAGFLTSNTALQSAIRFATTAAVGAGTVAAASGLANLPGRTRRAAEYNDMMLSFPTDLISSDVRRPEYFMSLQFVKYQKRAIHERKSILGQGTVFLPIPNQLNDRTSLSYDNKSIGSMIGGFTEKATGGTTGAIALGTATEALTRLIGSAPDGDKILSAASAVSGLAINPFLTVIFKNPEFKTHRFSWKLMPKNNNDTLMLQRIIETIKYHMLPGLLSSSGVIFEYPEMVQIRIYPSSNHLYMFKPCIIKSLDLNFAPSGGPSFFRSVPGAPTAVEMSMELQEIEYFTKMDFPGGNIRPEESIMGMLAPGGLMDPSLLPSLPGSFLFGGSR